MLKATDEFTIKEPDSYLTSKAIGMAATTILQGPEDNVCQPSLCNFYGTPALTLTIFHSLGSFCSSARYSMEDFKPIQIPICQAEVR